MEGISKEAERSIAASSYFPGFRFSPTDEELILYYLKKKLDGFDKCVEVIPELDICKFEPWDLPSKAVIKSDQEWFFFSPRGKKYPNGSQSKRATEIGYWKATGKERAVKSGSNVIGTKRTLVFHIGRAPKGERTEWIMHEYCVAGKAKDALVVCRLRKKCEYHGAGGVNGEIQSESTDPSVLMASSGTYSGDYDKELISAFGGNKMGECYLKNKSSSSHDSHSVEQMEQMDSASASQSDWKGKDEILQPESATHHVANEFEDDLFAEILKDSIIQLDDECVPSSPAPVILPSKTTYGAQTMVTDNGDANMPINIVPRTYENNYNLPIHKPVVPRVYPSQGTANRRIRLRKLRRYTSPRKEELEEGSGENNVDSFKSMRSSKSGFKGWIITSSNCCGLSVFFIAMAMAILMFVYVTGPVCICSV